MWKFVCVGILLAQLVVAAKIGKVIGTMSVGEEDSLPPFGSFYTNKFSKIAREIVHNANETILATISVQKPLKGYPMIDSIKVADSKYNETSTGYVNFYLQKNDPIYANIKKKNTVSALFTNETTQYNNETSQMETVGYRVLITGFIAQIPSNTTMANSTVDALLDRHPEVAPILERLNTIICKLEIDQVCVIDEVSGPFCLTSDDYYYADVDA